MLLWDELKNAIERDDWQKLKRSEEMNREYQEFQAQILNSYSSVSEYVLKEKMEGREAEQGMILLPNDFPYDLDPEIGHYVLWFVGSDEDHHQDTEVLKAKFKTYLEEELDYDEFETLIYINPKHNQTIPQIPHCQVFVRFTLLKKENDDLNVEPCWLEGH